MTQDFKQYFYVPNENNPQFYEGFDPDLIVTEILVGYIQRIIYLIESDNIGD